LYSVKWDEDCEYRIGKSEEVTMAYFNLKSQDFPEGLWKALRGLILNGFWDRNEMSDPKIPSTTVGN
jgi:hypothetical protein